MKRGQQQPQTGVTDGAAPTQQPQTDWQSNTAYISRSGATATQQPQTDWQSNTAYTSRSGGTPTQQPQTDWQSNTAYTSRSAKNMEMEKKFVEAEKRNKKTELRVAELEQMCVSPGHPNFTVSPEDKRNMSPVGSGSVGPPGPPGPLAKKAAIGPDKRGPRGQLALGLTGLLGHLALQGRRGPLVQFALRLPGLLAFQDRKGPWARLAHQDTRESWAQLALSLLGLLGHLALQERKGPRAQLALHFPGLLGHLALQERKGPRAQLALHFPGLLGHLALQERKGPRAQLALHFPGLLGHLDHPDARDTRYWNQLDLGGGCPKGYRKQRGICYKVFTAQLKSFVDATATCRQDGGTLAMAQDAETNDLLISLYNAAISSGAGFWLGLSDTREEGVFEWANGTPLGAYRPWGQGEPHPMGRWGNNDQDCVVLSIVPLKVQVCLGDMVKYSLTLWTVLR
ncbi:hypothetical protein Bbelb_320710 [Branchiostoma belcheri]|nr:hypothetical protein Bbelb_320710 [Branchiostoma belcheri]